MSAVVDWMVDRTNPVVLRESRQLVRSRFAVGIMMAFLLIMVAAATLYVLTTGNKTYNAFSRGKDLFQILYIILGYATILFVPAHTALPFLGQKQSNSMDLLFVSTIPPRSIIFGKMISALWMTVLLFSVSLPFMVLTVLLRGIGLFEVLLYLAMQMALVLLATMGCLLLVCLPTSRVFTGLMGIGYFLLLLMFPGATMGFMSLGNVNGEGIAIFLVVVALLLPIAGALTTALISPKVSNRALPVRITLTICWIVAGLAAALGPPDALEIWTYIFVITAGPAIMICASDISPLSRRVQGSVPKNPLLRLLAFPFFTGPVSGWIWCMGIGGISVGVNSTLGSSESPGLFAWLLYGLMYSLMAVWIRRVTFVRRFCAEKYTWALALFLATLGCILPLLANFAVNPDGRAKLLWRVGNPFSAFDKDPETHLVFAGIVCAVFLLLNARWLFRQFAAFRPKAKASQIRHS